MPWFGNGRDLVQVVFLVAVPEDEAATYLDLVSGLACLSRDGAGVEGLFRAREAPELMSILGQVRLRERRPASL